MLGGGGRQSLLLVASRSEGRRYEGVTGICELSVPDGVRGVAVLLLSRHLEVSGGRWTDMALAVDWLALSTEFSRSCSSLCFCSVCLSVRRF